MSDMDPPRLASLQGQPELADLLRSAHEHLPTDDAVARLAAKLGVPAPGPGGGPGDGSGGAAGGGGASAAPPATPAAASATAAVSIKAIVVAAFVVGAGAAAYLSFGGAPAPAPRAPVVVTAAAPEVQAAPVLPSPPPRDEATEPAAPPVVPVHRNTKPAEKNPSATASADDPVARGPSEIELLTQARRLVRSDPSRALALTVEHAKLYPRGTLAQEREVLAIEALSALGNLYQARARARAFGAASPGSPYAERIARAIKKAEATEH